MSSLFPLLLSKGNRQCALFNILRDSGGFLVGKSFCRSPMGFQVGDLVALVSAC
jgi:hypothetical protein